MKKLKVNPGDRFDHLKVIRFIGRNLNQRIYECECDCGTILKKAGETLTRQTIKYKACDGKECKYSGIENLEQDMKFLKKYQAQSRRPDKERFRSVKMDTDLANQLLNMVWHS